MKIETILDALLMTSDDTTALFNYSRLLPKEVTKRNRQYRAFRARILRMVAIYRNFAEANGFDEKQAWFWTDEWQAKEREVDKEIT